MPEIGQNLSHYGITGKIGKGGMGEVFRAKDQKLGRDVAIKVLPEEFARDTDRVARFQREAKVLASLNHPNIATIHGLEESGGTNFLVLEFVEGQTLADKIKTGPITVEESLKLALQIAEALEAAHEKGVIHRDLKPANIKVTPEGKVKVLDFGLAKAYAGDREEVNLSNSPTLSDAATQQGVILGTAAYMSPEQAKGKAVDKRADIWAFGVVLFEMLTGRQVFTGETVSDTLASVLAREPKWQSLPSNLHPRIRLLLERCLKKEPKDRYGAINDARVDIQEVLADPSGALVQPLTAAASRMRLRTILPWVAAGAILAAVIAGVAVWKLKPSEPRQVVRLYYELPKDQQFSNLTFPVLAVSPDGKQLVYSTPKGLFLRSRDELNAKLIPGTEGNPQQPFFSPDGKWIGYWSGTDLKLKKIPVGGGAPLALCDAEALVGASWGAEDTIVFSTMDRGVMRVAAGGGTPESLVKAKPAYTQFFILPQVLPDGKSLLMTLSPPSRIMVQSLKSGEQRELFPGDSARYLPTGHILYSVENNLLAVSFNPGKLEVSAGGIPVVEGLLRNGALVHYAISESGTLAYIPGSLQDAGALGRTLVWVDREGKEEPIAAPPNNYNFPKISPNGTRVALTVGNLASPDIWIWDLTRNTLSRLTSDKNRELQCIWTPDSRRIVFLANPGGEDYGIYCRAADGTGDVEKLSSAADRQLMPWSLSRDGKNLLVAEFLSMTKFNIGLVSMEGTRERKTLIPNAFQPEISPDGRLLAYCSSESGRNEVYVRPFPQVDKEKWQASTEGGESPLWSPDGRELFYLTEDNSAMAIAVNTDQVLRLGTPKLMFRHSCIGFGSFSAGTPWDISPDGKRFLMIKEAAPSATAGEGPRKINIVVNWFEELKQRVPVK